MDIFSFGVHFTDEKSCRLHFKEQRDWEGVFVNTVVVQTIIGWSTNGVICVNPADQEPPCEVAQ